MHVKLIQIDDSTKLLFRIQKVGAVPILNIIYKQITYISVYVRMYVIRA